MNKLKNKFFFSTLLLSLFGCMKSYNGYVYDYDKKKPIEGVIVNDYINNVKTITDSKGYFSLKGNSQISSVIIFKKNGYIEDTIESIQIHNGESMEERFKGEKIYLFEIKSKFRDSIKKLNLNPNK
jgi:hypothetical protein